MAGRVPIADQLRVDAPPDAVWRAIADPTEHARWHPFVSAIAGGHELRDVRACTVLVGRRQGTTRERCIERDEGTRIVWAIEADSTGFGRPAPPHPAGDPRRPAGRRLIKPSPDDVLFT